MRRQLGISVLVVLLAALLIPATAEAGHRHHGHHGHHSYLSFGLHFGYPYFWAPYAYWPAYHYYRPYAYGYPGRDALGGLDLNVKPKKTEVYVDGNYIGLAKAFDGWPEYLWLPRGTYQLIFHNPGYQTVERELTVYPGVVLDVRVQMAPGASTPPAELARPPREQPAKTTARPPAPRTYRPAPSAEAPSAERQEAASPAAAAPARLRLVVAPGDASVYLDGHFLGRGDELAGLSSGLILEPGRHLLEVVRPGHELETVEFEAGAGETVELEVKLRSHRRPSGGPSV